MMQQPQTSRPDLHFSPFTFPFSLSGDPDFPKPDEPTGPTVPEPAPQPPDVPNPYPVTDPIPDQPTPQPVQDPPANPEELPPRIF